MYLYRLGPTPHADSVIIADRLAPIPMSGSNYRSARYITDPQGRPRRRRFVFAKGEIVALNEACCIVRAIWWGSSVAQSEKDRLDFNASRTGPDSLPLIECYRPDYQRMRARQTGSTHRQTGNSRFQSELQNGDRHFQNGDRHFQYGRQTGAHYFQNNDDRYQTGSPRANTSSQTGASSARPPSPVRQYDSYHPTAPPREPTPEPHSPRTTLGPNSRRTQPPTESPAPKRRRTVDEVLEELGEATIGEQEGRDAAEADRENTPPQVAPPSSKATAASYSRGNAASSWEIPRYGPESHMPSHAPPPRTNSPLRRDGRLQALAEAVELRDRIDSPQAEGDLVLLTELKPLAIT